MIKNYFKTAWRNLWRNKSFTIINIAGLAVGIAVCIVIFAVIRFELSFDGFHKNGDRIYRVLSVRSNADGARRISGVPYPLPTALKNDFPDMPSTAVYSEGHDQVVIRSEANGTIIKKFKEENGFFFVEPSFFRIFSFPLLAGDYNTLKEPNTALLTKETAERYFGDWKTAIGKTFTRNNRDLFTVKGILADFPGNTDFRITVAASYYTLRDFTTSTDWVSVASNHSAYILMPGKMAPADMDRQLAVLFKKYGKDSEGRPLLDDRQVVQSLSQVHFDAEPGNFLDRTISKDLINTLWLIAAFILLIACVNFINLSTAQAINRAKEVAVRKVMGSHRGQLRLQFFSETFLLTLAAVTLGLLISFAALPYIGEILGLPLAFNVLNDPLTFLLLAGMIVAIVLLAGFYPAIVLSRFNPVTALKSKITAAKTKGISLRRGLVVLQFVIAQGLIIGTLVIVKQMDYFKNHPLGFDRDAIINVSIPSDSAGQSKLDYLKTRLLAVQGVKNVSFSYASPADDGNWSSNFRFDHATEETNWNANLKWADADYLQTYGLTLAAGRNLHPSDTAKEFLVSETLLKRLGITDPAKALNKEINLWEQMKYPIVGVVKDFHALSLRRGLVPVLITTQKAFYGTAGIKLATADMAAVLRTVETIWNEVYPEHVYDQKFLDSKIANFYTQERRLSHLYKIFAALAIFLSCLGLYGLASFMALQKTREVGIRKVLGASVNSIILLFSKEFLMLIGIAFVVAAPLAWYFMHGWLQDFVYRVSIPWWILALSGLLAIVVALITIGLKAVKAALTNPVKALRTE